MAAPAEALAHLGEPRDFTVPRNDDRDLKFTGWQLSRETNFDVGQIISYTEIAIYVTKADRLITTVKRWRVNNEKITISEKLTTGVHSGPWQALEWLKADNNKVLGAVSKKAWVAACHAYPKLKAEEFERVE